MRPVRGTRCSSPGLVSMPGRGLETSRVTSAWRSSGAIYIYYLLDPQGCREPSGMPRIPGAAPGTLCGPRGLPWNPLRSSGAALEPSAVLGLRCIRQSQHPAMRSLGGPASRGIPTGRQAVRSVCLPPQEPRPTFHLMVSVVTNESMIHPRSNSVPESFRVAGCAIADDHRRQVSRPTAREHPQPASQT